MKTRNTHRPASIEGRYRHPIYSPKGAVEGAMLDLDGVPAQLVFERDGAAGAAAAFAALVPEQHVVVEAELQGPSSKGEAEHAVYAFGRLVKVDGRAPKPPAAATPGYEGTVVRVNHARHGAANGVVLDSGDFIHTRPDGFAELGLRVGDRIRADGDARPLDDGSGWVVEAQWVELLPRRRTKR